VELLEKLVLNRCLLLSKTRHISQAGTQEVFITV